MNIFKTFERLAISLDNFIYTYAYYICVDKTHAEQLNE